VPKREIGVHRPFTPCSSMIAKHLSRFVSTTLSLSDLWRNQASGLIELSCRQVTQWRAGAA
jgi:hypothetical protein